MQARAAIRACDQRRDLCAGAVAQAEVRQALAEPKCIAERERERHQPILAVARRWGDQVGPEPTLNPRQRIEALLAESAADGSLSRSQGELIERAMQLGRARVRGEMIPMRRVRTVPLGMDRQDLLTLFVRSVHARYPVVDSSASVVGVLDQTRVLLEPESSIESLMSQPSLLEADLPVREAISQLQASGHSLSIVQDRGTIVGIVTLKDLVEPLVGELASW